MGSSFHSSGTSLRNFDIAMIVISTVIVALRFWSRALPRDSKGVRFWWDDWVVLAALPFNIAACSLQICAVNLGMGTHVTAQASTDIHRVLKVLWASYFMSDLGVSLAKSSALFFYARIFTTRSRWFRYGLWLGQILNLLWWITSIARCLLFCTPVDKFWEPDKPGFCRSADAIYTGSAVPSVVIDVFVLLLPVPIIIGLSMKMSRKILVIGVFLSGYLVVAISLGRLITAIQSGSLINKDFTYYGVTLLIWVAAEPAITIISCCLPVIFYLARQCVERESLSPFASKQRSNANSSRSSKPPRNNNYRCQSSEHSLELIQRDLTTAAAPIGYAATASNSVPSGSGVCVKEGTAVSGIMVQKDVDVQSHADS